MLCLSISNQLGVMFFRGLVKHKRKLVYNQSNVFSRAEELVLDWWFSHMENGYIVL